MFRYDPVYDRLFENTEFVDLLCKFHSFNWDKMDKKEKVKVVEDFVKLYTTILGIGEMKVNTKNNDKNYAGSYMDIGGIVNVNTKGIDGNTSQWDLLDTLFHELRHNFQHRAISRNLTVYESVDEDLRKKWKLNFLVSPRGYRNYISTEDENSNLYCYQPVEKDAFMTGLALTRKSYEIVEKVLGEDKEFIKYARMNKNGIMAYFSEEEVYKENLNNCEEAVKEIFEKNNKEVALEKQCLKIASETMEKNIKDMTLDEIVSLFSVYVWAYLDDDYKLDLLREYDSRVNKYEAIKLEKEGNSAFKIDDKVVLREDIGNILNLMFSYQFKVKVDGIIAGKEPCNPRLKKELEINMYTEKKKKINFIEDMDNFILYSIQPYALYEGRVVIEWFKKVRDVEQEAYGIEKDNYDYWIDFYDNEKYIPYLEKFYEKPFEEIYGDLITGMQEKIKECNKKIRISFNK